MNFTPVRHPRLRRAALIAAALFAIVLGANGCAAKDQNDGAGDAPIAKAEDAAWTVYNAPDRYTNVAFRCVGPNGLYVPRNADAAAAKQIVVVPNDPQCSGPK